MALEGLDAVAAKPPRRGHGIARVVRGTARSAAGQSTGERRCIQMAARIRAPQAPPVRFRSRQAGQPDQRARWPRRAGRRLQIGQLYCPTGVEIAYFQIRGQAFLTRRSGKNRNWTVGKCRNGRRKPAIQARNHSAAICLKEKPYREKSDEPPCIGRQQRHRPGAEIL